MYGIVFNEADQNYVYTEVQTILILWTLHVACTLLGLTLNLKFVMLVIFKYRDSRSDPNMIQGLEMKSGSSLAR